MVTYKCKSPNKLSNSPELKTGLQYDEEAALSPHPGIQNVDSLSQNTVKTTQLYENIPTVSSPHHQNNIDEPASVQLMVYLQKHTEILYKQNI